MSARHHWESKIRHLYNQDKLAIAYNGTLIVKYNPRDEGFTKLVCSDREDYDCNCYFLALVIVNRLDNSNSNLPIRESEAAKQAKLWQF